VGLAEEPAASYSMLSTLFPDFFGEPFDYRPYVQPLADATEPATDDDDESAEAALRRDKRFQAELILYRTAAEHLLQFTRQHAQGHYVADSLGGLTTTRSSLSITGND